MIAPFIWVFMPVSVLFDVFCIPFFGFISYVGPLFIPQMTQIKGLSLLFIQMPTPHSNTWSPIVGTISSVCPNATTLCHTWTQIVGDYLFSSSNGIQGVTYKVTGLDQQEISPHGCFGVLGILRHIIEPERYQLEVVLYLFFLHLQALFGC